MKTTTLFKFSVTGVLVSLVFAVACGIKGNVPLMTMGLILMSMDASLAVYDYTKMVKRHELE